MRFLIVGLFEVKGIQGNDGLTIKLAGGRSPAMLLCKSGVCCEVCMWDFHWIVFNSTLP